MRNKIYIFCLFLIVFCFVDSKNYIGYKVLSLTPEIAEHVEFLHKLKKHYLVDLWREPNNLGCSILTHIKPELFPRLKEELLELRIKHLIVHENLQELLNREKTENIPMNVSDSGTFDFGIYNPYGEVISLMADLTTKYPKITKVEVIGKSYENRPIYSLKITSDSVKNKPSIIIECGIHAREWTSVSACAYFVNQLLKEYGSDTATPALLDEYEFNVVILSNPDGYVYTWTEDRMWRKSRSYNKEAWLNECRGVDLNRNFDYEHCIIGANTDPCQEDYCGDKPFSEPETRALRNLMISREGRIKAYFSIHSYSQLWMTPYGDTKDYPPNYPELKRIAMDGIKALKKPFSTEFKFGTIMNILYPVSGSSIDYAYVKRNIDIAYSLELRDNGTYGFLLPQKDILPMCIETYEGLIAAIKSL